MDIQTTCFAFYSGTNYPRYGEPPLFFARACFFIPIARRRFVSLKEPLLCRTLDPNLFFVMAVLHVMLEYPPFKPHIWFMGTTFHHTLLKTYPYPLKYRSSKRLLKGDLFSKDSRWESRRRFTPQLFQYFVHYFVKSLNFFHLFLSFIEKVTSKLVWGALKGGTTDLSARLSILSKLFDNSVAETGRSPT